MFKKLHILVIFALVLWHSSSSVSAQVSLSAALDDSRLARLRDALVAANLIAPLEASADLTLFAPNDDALEAFTGEVSLGYHATQRRIEIEGLDNFAAESLDDGLKLYINALNAKPTVNGIYFTLEDSISLENGFLYIISQVLVPGITDTITKLVQDTSSVSTLSSLISAAGFEDALNTPDGTFTAFGPVNDAFSNLDARYVASLTSASNLEFLQIVLGYHVLPVTYFSTNVVDADTSALQTLVEGVSVNANYVLGKVNAEGLNIITTNGVAHLLNGVLVPTAVDNIIANSKLTKLLAVATAANPSATLAEILNLQESAITVFAPLDDGISSAQATELLDSSALRLNVVAGHVAPAAIFAPTDDGSFSFPTASDGNIFITKNGEQVLIGGAQPVNVNIPIRSPQAPEDDSVGVLHTLDTIIKITNQPTSEFLSNPNSFFSGVAEFSTLLDLVSAVELAADTQSITLFAPTNSAFNALNANVVAFLTSNSNYARSVLTRVLQYHVVASVAFSRSLNNGQQVSTLAGVSFTVSVDEGSVGIDGRANVEHADINTKTGVIHVINEVLVPESDVLASSALSGATVFATAVASDDDQSLFNALTEEANQYTVFAPQNSALSGAVPIDALRYHVLSGSYGADTINGVYTTVQGRQLIVYKVGSTVYVNGIRVLSSTKATNGYVHIIESALSIPSLNAYEALSANSELSTLKTLVDGAALETALTDENAQLTIFAPTDAAIATLLSNLGISGLPENVEILSTLITGHVHNGAIFSQSITNDAEITQLSGLEITFNVNDMSVRIQPGNALVVTANIWANNAVIHVIDAVIPAEFSTTQAATIYGLDNFVAAVQYANLEDDVNAASDVTIFAPDNDALAAILDNPPSAAEVAQVLLQHVLEIRVAASQIGNGATTYSTLVSGLSLRPAVYSNGNTVINGAKVTRADINISPKATIHVIDKVISAATQNLVDVISSKPNLSILLEKAGDFADVVELLSDQSRSLTVFAPTNDAFNELSASALDNSATLKRTIETHVLDRILYSAGITNNLEVNAISDNRVTFSIQNGGTVTYGTAQIIETDNVATNGVLHVINKVVLNSAVLASAGMLVFVAALIASLANF